MCWIAFVNILAVVISFLYKSPLRLEFQGLRLGFHAPKLARTPYESFPPHRWIANLPSSLSTDLVAPLFSAFLRPQVGRCSSILIMPEVLDAPIRCCLDTLPIEIIHRIASCGPFRSAIALLQVSRAPYSACNDWTIFQTVIKNNAHHFDLCAKWDPTSLLERDSSVWSRYAYADSKAVQCVHLSHQFTATQLNKWLPHLMALHRKCLCRSRTSNIV
jgi:hypothetical protein